MVELGDELLIHFTEDITQMEEAYQAEHYELLTQETLTEADRERKQYLQTVLKQLNKATELNVRLSDLEAFGLDPQNSPTGDTGVPEGVLAWRSWSGKNIQNRVKTYSREGYIRKKKELEDKIKRARSDKGREKLEEELKKLKKAP